MSTRSRPTSESAWALGMLAATVTIVALMSGADPTTVVTSLPFVLVATLGVAFVVVDHRS